jgi:DNA polymerase I-like protein with 3'-5' exonuclease and polymerase domains
MACRDMACVLRPQERKALQSLQKIEMPLVRCLARMELLGFAMDVTRFDAMSSSARRKLGQLKTEFRA